MAKFVIRDVTGIEVLRSEHVNMLSNAEMSKEVYQATPFGMGMQVPAMKIDSINFSSGTTH